jgi:hypothetical protein
MSVCVLTDQKRQPRVRKMLEQAFVPARRTLGTGWVVTAILSSAGVTKSHGKNRNLRFIEEGRTIQPQPVTQAIAACIIPRYAAPMDFAPGGLTDDQKPSGARQLHNGSWTERQFCLTDPTSANVAQYAFQRHSEARRRNEYRPHPFRTFCPFNEFVRPHRCCHLEGVRTLSNGRCRLLRLLEELKRMRPRVGSDLWPITTFVGGIFERVAGAVVDFNIDSLSSGVHTRFERSNLVGRDPPIESAEDS